MEHLLLGHEALYMNTFFGDIQVLQEKFDLLNNYTGLEKLYFFFIKNERACNKT